MGLALPDVTAAIQRFESARHAVSTDVINMTIGAEVISGLEGVGDDLKDARQAERFVAYDKEGNPVYVRDWETALTAIARLKDLIDVTRPRAGGVNINTAIQTNVNANGGSGGPGRSFEAMVREAEKKQKQERRLLGEGDDEDDNDESVEDDDNILDADVIEGDVGDGGDADAAGELEGREGIELDDPDKTGDEEEEEEDA